MELKSIIEAILFSSARPVSLRYLTRKLSDFPPDDVARALSDLTQEYYASGRAMVIQEVAGGFQMRTRPDYREWVTRFVREKEVGLTKSLLEVLSIIAYKQPISKREIDQMRGVDSSRAIKILLERHLIELGGRLDDVGKPVGFRTTHNFLETYGLKNLADLPTFKEVEALES
ncbi:MAG TPA: SMC-Scp complex subunit ScpB [Syntrophorhabdaceae bacterium]|jgi:segregation and condensation protein B